MSIAIFGGSQIVRLTSPFLNRIDDPIIGGPLASPIGSIYQAYGGQLGNKFSLDAGMALMASDTTIGTLYGGVYQYVKFKAGTTAANARGQIVFWDDIDKYVVTPDGASTNDALWAGLTLNVVTKGNYGWVQIAGKGSIKYRASVTKTTPVVDDLVVVTAGSNVADVLADATAITSPSLKLVIGAALSIPAGSAVGQILMRGTQWVH